MKREISYKKLLILLLLGALGCLFMGGSDWLMIYGDTACEGSLSWLTLGTAEIPAQRNSLALLLAFPAVVLYAFGLFALRYFIPEEKRRRNYCALTAVGMTPWLALHLFYVMILFAFGNLMQAGESAMAYRICEAVFAHFSWVIILAELLMILPFIYLLILIAMKKTLFAVPMLINNPLIIFVLLKLLTSFMPDTAAKLAFTNGLMSEAMLIWFAIYMLRLKKYYNQEEVK